MTMPSRQQTARHVSALRLLIIRESEGAVEAPSEPDPSRAREAFSEVRYVASLSR
jgi:hypothetical protein